MHKTGYALPVLAVWALIVALNSGCAKGTTKGGNPVIPSDDLAKRHAMYFYEAKDILGYYEDGYDYPAADVDLAPVVWAGAGNAVVSPTDRNGRWQSESGMIPLISMCLRVPLFVFRETMWTKTFRLSSSAHLSIRMIPTTVADLRRSTVYITNSTGLNGSKWR